MPCKRFSLACFLLLITAVPHLFAAAAKPLNIPLTVQEAVYPGAATRGIDRSQDPLTVGIPLADSENISSVSQLGLSGASVGQFRILGRWPSGNIKWLLIDTQTNLTGGTTSRDIALTNGRGNYGGPDLARDQGSVIVVSTGTAEFVIRKSKFNIFDRVSVNGKSVVEPGTSQGMVIMGPRTEMSVPSPPRPQVSGSPGQKTYWVRVSYETIRGETEASPRAIVSSSPGGHLSVVSPPQVSNATGYYVYASDGSNPEFLQTATPVPLGRNWTSDGPLATTTRRFPEVSGVGTGCGVCDVAYTSSNDAGSTATIEENGPARAVIRASGSHVDSAGHTYMHYTVRMHFYKGKTYAKVELILRNANDVKNPNGDFNSAYKGFASYEVRLAPHLTGSPKFEIGTDRSSVSGSLNGGDDAYLYQGYSDYGEIEDWNAHDCVLPGVSRCVASYIRRTSSGRPYQYTYAQDGFQVIRGNQVVASGNHTKYPQGWADLTDSTGVGVEIGVYELSGYWPKSLQFTHGGREVAVGIWPDQNLFRNGGAQPYYQAWPAYSVHDLYFNFHSSALSSPANEFLKFQHFLLARAPREQYNRAGVLFYPLPDPKAEDHLYASIGAGCCLADRAPKIFRYYSWPEAGAGNQHDMRWSYLRNWLQRGYAGRYIFAANFYRMVVEHSFPRSDGFHWRDHPVEQLSWTGFPEEIPSANGSKAIRNWIDAEHAHWYGMTDYYFLTGDETVKDQLLNGAKDRFANVKAKANNGRLWGSRDVGEQLMGIARLYDALRSMNDPDTDALLQVANQTLDDLVFPELNVSGFGTGRPVPGIDGSQGISRTRGVHYGCCTRDTMPGHSGRAVVPFHEAILAEGMWELAQVLGPAWPKYTLLKDLTYGVAEWSLKETFAAPPGQRPNEQNSGFIYEIFLDQPNADLKYFQSPGTGQTNWFNFFVPGAYAGDLSWRKNFEGFLHRVSHGSTNWAEYGSHMVQAVVDEILEPPDWQLVNVPLSVAHQDGGTYVLSWTVPRGAQSYRIKYNSEGKDIVEWLNFDPGPNTFGVDPNKNWPWFACNEAGNVPPPASPGTTQTYTFKGEPSKSYKFALKAAVSRR